MDVLFGICGSEESFAALEEVIRRATQAGDDLTIAIVDRDTIDRSPEDIEAEVRDRLAETDLDPEIRRLTGHPGARLAEVADGEDFDRLMVSGGERSSLGKIHLNKMLEFIVFNSETTVTLVR